MRKNFLLIITLVLMCLGLLGIWGQGGNGANISFLKNPWITGPSGTYTKYTNEKGDVRWSPGKSDPTVVIQSEARGFGDVTSTLTNITIEEQVSPVSGSDTSIGSMPVIAGWPFSAEAIWSYSSHGKRIPFIETPGEYRWSASGDVKLTPYVWKWKFGVDPYFMGDWVKKPELADTEGAKETSGSWSVVHMAECSGCGSSGDTASDVCAGSESITCSQSCGCKGENASDR